MMNDLWNYDTSWLNPALKFAIPSIYVVVAFLYYRARHRYSDNVNRALTLLFWMGTFAAAAALLRYFGDGTQFGFTKQFSLKWLQSLGYILQAILFVLAGIQLAKVPAPTPAKVEPDSSLATPDAGH
jgi:hypothetical protein